MANYTISLFSGYSQVNHYYPFGMVITDRTFSSASYRYGFNMMENDSELRGEETTYFTYHRIYDARLCIWFSLDPKRAQFPDESPYLAFHNNPQLFIDPKGDGPPEGFASQEGVGGESVLLPESAIVTTYGETTDQYKEGQVESFTIGDKTYTAKYGEAGFIGYFYYSGINYEKYQNPDITFSGGFSGKQLSTMQMTFNVSNVPASGLQIVQIISYTPLTKKAQRSNVGMPFNASGFISGQYYYADVSGENFAGEVDGGIGSFYSYQDGGPANASGPYYYSEEELKVPGLYTWNGKSGSILALDIPSARVEQEKMYFTTMIVAKNYMGTGQDIILATYTWGWTNYGKRPTHSKFVSIKGNQPTAIDINIIHHYYPGYIFIK